MTTTTKKKHGGERLVYNRVQTVIQFGIVIELYYLCNVVREDTVSFEFGFSSPCLRRHKELLNDFLSDQIAYKILDEEADLNILKVAEKKVSYLKTIRNG